MIRPDGWICALIAVDADVVRELEIVFAGIFLDPLECEDI